MRSGYQPKSGDGPSHDPPNEGSSAKLPGRKTNQVAFRPTTDVIRTLDGIVSDGLARNVPDAVNFAVRKAVDDGNVKPPPVKAGRSLEKRRQNMPFRPSPDLDDWVRQTARSEEMSISAMINQCLRVVRLECAVRGCATPAQLLEQIHAELVELKIPHLDLLAVKEMHRKR